MIHTAEASVGFIIFPSASKFDSISLISCLRTKNFCEKAVIRQDFALHGSNKIMGV
ncbi:hypothetical protein GTCCBUS3UF5_4330 [Geobacillus thermoleovorans CCB_US3_UF5]|uniref:Uncharacterized protein n=1 Tax=Geobacillus thermoleovorans CCB_US3_UF5 TaxID=1111068 RepID=A0ABM5MDJ6_GEOTH|nr:hypothetical protein GTCCBUS3UF5_4330 [Geobacillus thermoleovorans CCB_US3_UF5]